MAIVETAAMWALEGFVSGLGRRLANAPGQKVRLRTIELNVLEIRAEQERLLASQSQMQEAIGIAFDQLRQLLVDNEALKVRRDEVFFKPTKSLPTIGSALFELDAQIEALRATDPVYIEAPRKPDVAIESPRYPSVFEGIDDEIDLLRRGGKK